MGFLSDGAPACRRPSRQAGKMPAVRVVTLASSRHGAARMVAVHLRSLSVGRWRVTTPGAHASPLLNQERSRCSARPDVRPSPSKGVSYPTMCMKTKWLTGYSWNFQEIVYG
jgi:hypothetical protein